MPTVGVGNGLVTSQDISTAPDGSLLRAEDCYYKPNNQATWKAPGRSKYNAAPEAGPIIGIRALVYDGATDVITAHVGTAYREGALAATGTLSDAVTGLSAGSAFDSIHYNNSHVLLNGIDRGQVRDSSGVYTLLGMLANTTAPFLNPTAGTGTEFILASGSKIRYWIEERVKSGTDILRRNASSPDQVVTLTGDGVTTYQPVITRPVQKNSDATHWALFASATDGAFPAGAEIAEVSISTPTIEDSGRGDNPDLPDGDEYDIISVSIAGLVFNVAKHGQPPILATGDILDDRLYGWDVNDRSLLKFTIPDNINAWPSVNVIRFETKEEDEGQVCRTVGRIAIAVMRDSAWRVQTLPAPEDSAFQPERVKIQIDGAFGAAGPLAADIFNMGSGSRLAYISPDGGIVVTDGYSWGTVHDDLDWEETVDIAQLGSSRLTNNPSQYRLEMTAVQKGTGIVKQWWFHYHSSHLKKADETASVTFKVTGPINQQATSKTRALLNGKRQIFTGHTDGTIYLDGGQETDASGNTIAMDVESKEQYYAGVGGRANVRNVYAHHQDAPGQTAKIDLIMNNSGEDETVENATIDLSRRESTRTAIQGRAEAHRLRFRNSDTSGPVALDYFIADVGEVDKARGT